MEFASVIAAAAAAFVLGAIYYGALAKPWVEASGVECDEDGKPKGGQSPAIFAMAFVLQLIVAGMMRHVFTLSGIDTLGAGLVGGAGIGLSLTREFVELHGGTVDVEPTDGPGATFRVRIPLGSAHLSITEVQLATDEELTPVPVPTTVNDEDRSSPDLPLALVVEDHPDMRAFVADQLAAAFSVVTAVDGRDALDQLEAGLSPKVVVSDVMMPRLDGLGLCRALRADPRWAALPLLLLSAKATEDDTLAGLDVADDYLTKPFRSAELVLRARKLAGRPQEELSAQSSNPFVEKIEALVEEHMADARLGAAQLAKLAGLSPRQFQRRLKEEVGESPAAWVRGRRLLAARDLMQRGSVETVGEAAAAVGMNRSYLARVYQAWAGHPPSEDLRRNRTQV